MVAAIQYGGLSANQAQDVCDYYAVIYAQIMKSDKEAGEQKQSSLSNVDIEPVNSFDYL